MKSKRKDQLTEVIRRELALILPKHIRLETYRLINISYIELNSDLSLAKIFVSALNNIELLQNELNFKLRDIQSDLNKTLYIKVVPKLILKADQTSKESERIEKLLNNI